MFAKLLLISMTGNCAKAEKLAALETSRRTGREAKRRGRDNESPPQVISINPNAILCSKRQHLYFTTGTWDLEEFNSLPASPRQCVAGLESELCFAGLCNLSLHCPRNHPLAFLPTGTPLSPFLSCALPT